MIVLEKNLRVLLDFTLFYLFSQETRLPKLFYAGFMFPGIRECAICGMLATNECKNCYREFGDGLDKIAFCDICLRKVSVLSLSA